MHGEPRRRDRSARGARSERDSTRRTLSQNFLRGDRAASLYLDQLDIDPDGLVVEVGAGDGTLTGPLAERCRRLIAFELDPEVARKARARVAGRDNVNVVVGDFLRSTPPEEWFQVVGNVPFGQTSAIVDWCLDAHTITAATIITQLEYARKRTGWYGRWSRLTIHSWPWFLWELRGRIDRGQFRPVPKVDAAVLHLAQRRDPLVGAGGASAYGRMVDLGFSGVGGSLSASLSRAYRPRAVAVAFDGAGVDRNTVVGYVTPRNWLDIFDALEGARR